MRVLLIRLSSLGDVVLATAAVEGLRADVPEVEVHVLTKPAFREVFRNNPGVHRVLEWDPTEGLSHLARLVRAGAYDWIADLHGNLRTRALRLLVRGSRWTRYRKGAHRRRLAVLLRRPGLLQPIHVVDRYLGALHPLGVRAERHRPRVYPGALDGGRARSLLNAEGWKGDEPAVALAPGARWATKAWPPERWAELIARIGRSRLGFPVLLGGLHERTLCSDILAASETPGANLAGKTSILETAAALQTCAALVTNDSAPLQLAGAVGTPVVALFGPTVRGFGFYPLQSEDAMLELDFPCRPCSLHGNDRCPRGHHGCLRDLPAEAVMDALTGVLEGRRKQAVRA